MAETAYTDALVIKGAFKWAAKGEPEDAEGESRRRLGDARAGETEAQGVHAGRSGEAGDGSASLASTDRYHAGVQRIGLYVFTALRGGRIGESFVLKALKRDQVKLKLPDGDLHGFRRFFATSMMRAGVDAETVRQWGGWKSLETMLRYLADVEVKDSVRAMDLAVKRLAAS
jgi:hypothetical protein